MELNALNPAFPTVESDNWILFVFYSFRKELQRSPTRALLPGYKTVTVMRLAVAMMMMPAPFTC